MQGSNHGGVKMVEETEGGGLAGSLALKSQVGRFEQSGFRQAERGAVNNNPCGIWTKVCFRHFISTTKNHIDLW